TGCFAATADRASLPRADAWFICVPTPLDGEGRPDLGPVRAALETCRAGLRPGALVCLVSTCQPGATNGLCRDVLERDGALIGQDVYLAVSPEREDPGRAESPRRVPRLLGAPDAASLARARGVWERLVDRVVPVATPEIAECAKLLENAYRLVNIALMDELHRGFAALGVPTRAVVAAAATKPFGFAPFWPGAGAGGHCIPVDPGYLQMELARAGQPSALVALAAAANAARPRRVVDAVAAEFDGRLAGRRILVMGVTYKPGVADLRVAAPVAILSGLAARGAVAMWHDPLPVEVEGFARVEDPARCPDGPPEAVILGTPQPSFDLAALPRLAPVAFDPFGLLPRDAGRVVVV
ncbi:nucleotide sugar dehydrogenase, partial [Neoroseomonas rubea]|uniref:nucleotide sugar dehydrogenase n=1 Tax=Neoroseomonas rubea TaxID=2748666 RepID=UPI0018E0330C